jgi:hypothetical protein
MLVEGCSPTKAISYTYFTDDMRQCIRNTPHPWAVLLLEHIIWINWFYTREFEAAVDDGARMEVCCAALCHATLYLG